jgi:EmrB/QacA subfamily drug resistance transporter
MTTNTPQLSLFLSALDQTITATAIPTIANALHSSSGYFWIGGAYQLATAASGPIWANLSDIWGRKLAMLGSVIIFAGASILAALASNMPMLIAGRALQGTAAGGISQLVNIVISDLFSQRSRSLYIGLCEVIWALAGGLGPIIGGAFTQLVDWRWIFWINLPFAGITLVLLFLFLDVHNPRTKLSDGVKAIDWFGTLGVLAVVLLLLLGLDFGGVVFPWNSAKVICLLAFGVVMIGFFIFSERKLAKYPLMPLSMFKSWSNNAAYAVTFCHGLTFITAEYYMPLYFQSCKGAGPLRSGVLILPLDILTASSGIVAGVVIHQTGRYRELAWVGMTFLAVGMGLFVTLNRTTSVAKIAGFQIVEGIGSGLLFEAPLIAVHAMVSQRDTATATATLGMVRNIATAMGIVIGGVVFQNGMTTRVSSLRAAGLNETLVDAFDADKAAANVELIKTIENDAQRKAVQDAFAWSLRNMWICFTAVAGLGLLVSAFIKHKYLKKEHTETRTGIGEMTKREDGN